MYPFPLILLELSKVGTLSREIILSKLFELPSDKRSNLIRTNFIPRGANSFLFEKDPFSDRNWCTEKQTGSHKVDSLVKSSGNVYTCIHSVDYNVRTFTFVHVHPAKTQISLYIRKVGSVFRFLWFCVFSVSKGNPFWLLFHYPPVVGLDPWLFVKRPAETLIRLRKCADWYEYSPGAHIRRYIYYILLINNTYYND